jgi:hypothetical protein
LRAADKYQISGGIASQLLLLFHLHICLDKYFPLWLTARLNNMNRGPDNEKDIDEFQQHEDEADPWLPCADVYQGRQGRS